MTTVSNNIPAQTGATLTVEGKLFGRGNKTLFPNFQLPLPANWHNESITLRTLLDAVVRGEVAAFRERQQQRTLLQSLTAAQIADGVAKGKVDSGGNPDAVQEVNADESVQAALQAFEDGIFFVFVNDAQKTDLDETFFVAPDTRITFLRLVALAGG